MITWRRFLSLFLLMWVALGALSALGAEAPSGSGIRVGSIEWQKLDLEAKLQDRIHNSILKLIPEKYFTVSVGITIKKPEGKATPEPEKAAAAKKKKSEPTNRISLGKLDFDAPLIDENDEDPYFNSFGERKAERVINLFDVLEKATVVVLIDSTIPDSKKEIILRLVKTVTSPLGQSVADITIDKVDLYNPKAYQETWDGTRWVTELKVPVAIVLATFIITFFLSVVLLIAFRSYFNIEKRKTAVVEAQNAREAAAQEAATTAAEEARLGTENAALGQKADTLAGGSELAPQKDEDTQTGFERFKLLLAESPEKMSELVRHWIKAPGRGATEALVVLPQILTTAECLQLFKFINQEDRREWKKILTTPIDDKGYKIADNFIAFQIVDSLLVPQTTNDPELQELLSGISIADCLEISTNDVLLGSLLLDLLPTAQAGRLYGLMPRDLADSIATAVLKVSEEEITAQSANLKQAIKAAANKKKSVPFLDRASDLVSIVGPEREDTILKALADAGEFQLLEATAKQFFPSELILKLPRAAIKASLERYPSARRAEIIVSRAEDQQGIFLESIGKTGTRARDLIDVEIQQIQSDEVRKKRIEKSRNLIWREFIETVRALIKTNETIGELSKDVMSDWLSEKTAGQFKGSDVENAA